MLTGVPNGVEGVRALFEALNHDGIASHLRYRVGSGESAAASSSGRVLEPIEALFLTLFILRTGVPCDTASFLWGIGTATASRTFEIWVLHMYHTFRVLLPDPTKEQIERSCPAFVKEQFDDPGMAYFLDASEIEMQVADDKQAQKSCWSEYKHRCTVKFLGALTSGGCLVWVSKGYPGSIGDNAITEISGFLDILHPGMSVCADKGFMVFYLLAKRGCRLVVPPKRRKGQVQQSTEEVEDTRKVANIRIHVERAFRQVKIFRYLQNVVKISAIDLITPIFYVCTMLTNLRPPLIQSSYVHHDLSKSKKRRCPSEDPSS